MIVKDNPSGSCTVSIETRVLGTHAAESPLRLPAAPLTIAALIRAKITDEWERGTEVGRESAPPDSMRLPAYECTEDAVRETVDAYHAGWLLVMVNGNPSEGLDQVIMPADGDRISFVRICPLPDR